MSLSTRRVRAVFRKELREYRRNGAIIATMAIFPLIVIIQPLIAILVVSSKASKALAHEEPLLYLLAIPALVPATLASYSVVGERQQGTLEPVLRRRFAARSSCSARPWRPSYRPWSSPTASTPSSSPSSSCSHIPASLRQSSTARSCSPSWCSPRS